jgi:hypothetical protein
VSRRSWPVVRVISIACTTILLAACAQLAPPQIVIPSCPPNAACPEGFVIGTRSFFFPCVMVRREAVETVEYIGGAGPYVNVRGITGLPPESFVAVRGDVPCGGPDPRGWWLAQADEITAGELEALTDRLGEVIVPGRS